MDHLVKLHLLHFSGLQNHENLSTKLAPVKPKDKNYVELVELLKQQFASESNEIVENYRFYIRRQREGDNEKEKLQKNLQQS